MLNVISLLLGLAAWVLGLTATAKKGRYGMCIGSFTLCGASLVVQFFEIQRRVALSDWSALADTSEALSTAAALLLVVTVILNLTALWRGRRVR